MISRRIEILIPWQKRLFLFDMNHIRFFHIWLILAAVASFILAGCRSMPFNTSSKKSQSLSLSQEAIAAYERKQYDLAADKFSESLKLNQDDCETRRYYAENLWQQGKKEESLTALIESLVCTKSKDDRMQIYESLGEKYLAIGSLHHANQCAEQLIDLDSQSSRGWYIRAICASRNGQNQEALADFQRALAYAPDDTELLQELVHLQMRMNRYDRALATWQHLARLYSAQDEPPGILYGKAYCMYRLRRLQDADDHMTLALSRQVDRPEFHWLLTQICMEKGEVERAAQAASNAVARFPEDENCRRSWEQVNRQLLAGRELSTKLN